MLRRTGRRKGQNNNKREIRLLKVWKRKCKMRIRNLLDPR